MWDLRWKKKETLWHVFHSILRYFPLSIWYPPLSRIHSFSCHQRCIKFTVDGVFQWHTSLLLSGYWGVYTSGLELSRFRVGVCGAACWEVVNDGLYKVCETGSCMEKLWKIEETLDRDSNQGLFRILCRIFFLNCNQQMHNYLIKVYIYIYIYIYHNSMFV